MSNYQFKVGDKVRYKAEHKGFAKANKHDSEAVYTVNAVDDGLVYFGESDRYSGCFASRLELAEDSIPETFDYRQALKILAENHDVEIEFSANGVFWGKVAIPGEIRIPTGKEFCFRLKPQPKKYQWLYKTKASGQYFTTTGKFESQEEAEKAFEGDHLIFIKPLNEETL